MNITETLESRGDPVQQHTLVRGYIVGAVGGLVKTSFEATPKSGSTVLTEVSAAELSNGALLKDTVGDIPTGTTIVEQNSHEKTIVMSKAATASHAKEACEAIGPARKRITAPVAMTKVGSEENFLWVVIPAYSTQSTFGPCNWAALHGTTLPKEGNYVEVGFDEENRPTVLWWEGEQAEPEGTVLSVAMFYRKEPQKLPKGIIGLVKVDTVIKDPGSHFSSEKGYKVTAEGYYHVDGNAYFGTAAANIVQALIYVNEVVKLYGVSFVAYPSGPSNPVVNVSGIVFCKVGDIIELWAGDNSFEPELTTTPGANLLTVQRVGEGPPGEKGATGEKGEKGEKGSTGPEGKEGKTGPEGTALKPVIGHTFAVSGTPAEGEIPGFSTFESEAYEIIAADIRTEAGTAVVTVLKNKEALTGYESLTAKNEAAQRTSSTKSLASKDYISLKIGTVTGATNLSVTVYVKQIK